MKKLESLSDKNECPFYGFFLGHNVILEQGNHCPFIYNPCTMQKEGKTPDFSKCHYTASETHEDAAILIKNSYKSFF